MPEQSSSSSQLGGMKPEENADTFELYAYALRAKDCEEELEKPKPEYTTREKCVSCTSCAWAWVKENQALVFGILISCVGGMVTCAGTCYQMVQQTQQQ